MSVKTIGAKLRAGDKLTAKQWLCGIGLVFAVLVALNAAAYLLGTVLGLVLMAIATHGAVVASALYLVAFWWLLTRVIARPGTDETPAQH